MYRIISLITFSFFISFCSTQKETTSSQSLWFNNIPKSTSEYLYTLGIGKRQNENMSCRLAHSEAYSTMRNKLHYMLQVIPESVYHAEPLKPVDKKYYQFIETASDTLFGDFLTTISKVKKDTVINAGQTTSDNSAISCYILIQSSTPDIIEAIDKAFAKHDSIYTRYRESYLYPMFNSEFHTNYNIVD